MPIVLLAVLALAALAVPTSAAEEPAAHTFLCKTIGFTDAQIVAVDAGQVPTKQLPAADKPEIAVFGAVRVRADRAAVVDQLRRSLAGDFEADGIAVRRVAEQDQGGIEQGVAEGLKARSSLFRP